MDSRHHPSGDLAHCRRQVSLVSPHTPSQNGLPSHFLLADSLHNNRPKRLAEQNTVVAVSSKDDGDEEDAVVPGISAGEDQKRRDAQTVVA